MIFDEGPWTETDAQLAAKECRAVLEDPNHIQMLDDVLRRGGITSAHYQPLSFYRDRYQLLRLTLDPERLQLGDLYSATYLFFLKSKQDARLLTGASPVIHSTNSLEFGTNGTKSNLLDVGTEEKELDYLRFFCAFVAGDLGPFCLVESISDFGVHSDDSGARPKTFATLVERRKRAIVWPKDLLDLTASDLEAFAEDPNAARTDFKQRAQSEQEEKARDPKLEDLDLKEVTHLGAKRDEESSQRVGGFASAFVWYGPGVFEARFLIKPDGMVEMLDDSPVSEPRLPGWRFLETGMLVRQQRVARAEISPDLFIKAITGNELSLEEQDAIGPDALAHNDASSFRLRNALITGDVDLTNEVFDRDLHLEGVVIDGDFLLEDTLLRGRTRFEDLAVTGRLVARGIQAQRLEAPRLRIGGIFDYRVFQPSDGERPVNGLDLSDARFVGGFNISRSVIGGGIRARRIKCEGAADLSWLTIHQRMPVLERASQLRESGNADDAEDPWLDGGLDLSESQFLQGLLLTGRKEDPAHGVTSKIAGGVRLPNCTITGSLRLQGLVTETMPHSLLRISPENAQKLLDDDLPQLKDDSESGENKIIAAFNPFGDVVGVKMHHPRSGDIDLQKSSISQELSAHAIHQRTLIDGDIRADGLSVGGKVDFGGVRIGYRDRTVFDRQPQKISSGNVSLAKSELGELVCQPVAHDKAFEVIGKFDISQATIQHGLKAAGAIFEGDLDASGAAIGSDFDLDVSTLTIEPAKIGGSLLMSGANVSGTILARSITVAGILDMERISASGVVITAVRFERIQVEAIDAARTQHIAAGLPAEEFDPTSIPKKIFWRRPKIRQVDLKHGSFDEGVNFDGAQIETSLVAHGATFNRSISIGGTYIGKDADFDSCRISHMLNGNSDRFRTEIVGRLTLSDATVSSDVRFTGAKIGDGLQIITGRFGRIQIRPDFRSIAHEEERPENEEVPDVLDVPEIGNILIQSASATTLDLFSVEVKEDISIDSLTLSERLSFYKSNPSDYLLFGHPDGEKRDAQMAVIAAHGPFRAKVGGKLQLRELRVGGDLDLTAVCCESDIKLDRFHVGGDLLTVDEQIEELERFNTIRLDCQTFEVQNGEIDGHAKLCGVQANSGLILRHTKIAHETTLCSETLKGACVSLADENGSVNLKGIDTQKLRLQVPSGKETTTDLEDARIDILEAVGEFGGEIRLKNARVGDWAFVPDSTKQSTTIEQLLKHTEFEQGVYRDAERWLRRRGDEPLADRLHRAWRRLSRKQRSARDYGELGVFIRPLDVIADRLTRWFTGYWTRGWTLFVPLILLLACMTVPLTMVPENIAPSPLQMGEEGSGLKRTDKPDKWPVVEQLRIVAANHLPIIPVVIAPRWEFTEQHNAYFRIPGVQESLPLSMRGDAIGGDETRHAWRLPMSPAAYAFLARLLSWIAWPVFLIGLAASIQRRRDI